MRGRCSHGCCLTDNHGDVLDDNERLRDVLLDVLDVTRGYTRNFNNAERVDAIDRLVTKALKDAQGPRPRPPGNPC